jgi:hypothetical protein
MGSTMMASEIPEIQVRDRSEPVLDMYRWGFIPAWAKDPSIGNRMIHVDYVWGVAKALQGELGEGFLDVPPQHPSYDAGLEQVFEPAPPTRTVRSDHRRGIDQYFLEISQERSA